MIESCSLAPIHCHVYSSVMHCLLSLREAGREGQIGMGGGFQLFLSLGLLKAASGPTVAVEGRELSHDSLIESSTCCSYSPRGGDEERDKTVNI